MVAVMKKIMFFVLFMMVLSSIALAQTKQDAQLAIDQMSDTIEEMRDANFTVLRLDDLYTETYQLFIGQVSLEESGKEPDYSFVIATVQSVHQMRDDAFAIDDEIYSLGVMIDDLKEAGIKNSDIDLQFDQLKAEFNNERYEQAQELINQLYDDISEAESEATQISILYESNRRNIVGFLEDNWKGITISLVILIVVILVGFNEITVYRLNYRKKRLHFEKTIVLNLIKNIQKKYFEQGLMSEGEYTIKISKFRELIRDIDRIVPLLNEQLIKRKTFFVKPHLKTDTVVLRQSVDKKIKEVLSGKKVSRKRRVRRKKRIRKKRGKKR